MTPVKDAVKPNAKKPQMQQTSVYKWLKSIGEVSLGEKFYNAGWFDIEDLDKKAIKKVIDHEPTQRRLIRQLGTKTGIPDLPPGHEIDLSAGELKDPAGNLHPLPGKLPASTGGEYVLPTELSTTQWMVIAKHANVLLGRNLSTDAAGIAEKAVLWWKVPENTNYVQARDLKAKVSSELAYTETQLKQVAVGLPLGGTLGGGIPLFGGGSFGYERRTKDAKNSYVKRLYILGQWNYPRAKLFLKHCTTVSPEFVSAVKKAVESESPVEELAKVFQEYGHVVGDEVVLGGRLQFVHSEVNQGSRSEHEATKMVRFAVNLKVKGADVEGKGSFGDGASNQEEAYKIAKQESFTAIGGDTTLANNPTEWPKSVKDPNHWATIAFEKVKRTVDLLDEPLRSQVLNASPQIKHPLNDHTFGVRSVYDRDKVLSFYGKYTSGRPYLGGDHPLLDVKDKSTAWQLMMFEPDPESEQEFFFVKNVETSRLLTCDKRSKPGVFMSALKVSDTQGQRNPAWTQYQRYPTT